MAELQGAVASSEYESGSPHLLHAGLRNAIIEAIRALILDRFEAQGRCRVLEVGPGHGVFTDHAVACGAEVTAMEVSPDAAAQLRRRLRHCSAVTIVDDPDGNGIFRTGESFDVLLFISVLHHIPDYLGYLRRALDGLAPDGALLSYQDPLFYPRQASWERAADRGSFLCWRIWRGDLRRGVGTQLRRWRGSYDESAASDMVEYHVVRQGVDELAVSELLRPQFREVELRAYWSTPSRFLQRLGSRAGWTNTFSVHAVGRLAETS